MATSAAVSPDIDAKGEDDSFSTSPLQSLSPSIRTDFAAAPTLAAVSPASSFASSFASSSTSRQSFALRPSNLAPTTSGFGGFQPSPTPVPNGPMSSSIAVPARPKPGRKAATDEPENKRKAQNRAAQRAFRERKQYAQKSLEETNKEFKAANDAMSAEVQVLRKRIELDQLNYESSLVDSRRREHEFKEKWQGTLSSITTFQQRSQEAEAKARQYQDDIRRLTAELVALRARVDELTRSSSTISASRPSAINGLAQPQVPIPSSFVSSIPQKRHLAVNGCGNCEENGACPCVDSYIDTAIQAGRDVPPIERNLSSASMSINSLLSPDTSRSDPQIDMPELTSDQSSPEELETDFTHFSKPVASTPAIANSEKCGFCVDDSNCICADENAVHATSPAAMGPPKTTQPGTCLQCQQNPEQKAYCESLARERLANRSPPQGQPDAKRSRMDLKNFVVPCSEAYTLYKQYSRSGETPSYDDVYKAYMSSDPAGRQGLGTLNNGLEPKMRQFSAYETDIASVIATLHRQDTRSSGENGESDDSMRKMSTSDTAIPTLQPNELPRRQSGFFLPDLQSLRRPSTALAGGWDVMQWTPSVMGTPLGTGTPSGGLATFMGPPTPSIWTTAFQFPSMERDLSRFSLSFPNSAATSPPPQNGSIADGQGDCLMD